MPASGGGSEREAGLPRAPAAWAAASPAESVAHAQLFAMQHMNRERSLLLVNGIVDRCFDGCIDDFSITKSLRAEEERCIRACTQKYLLFSAAVGNAFSRSLTDP